MTRVKICGLTRLEDARLAVELGAWALGVVLSPDSPRSCDQADAELIARECRRSAEIVGVFVNATLDEVAEAADVIGLSIVQLHGDEGVGYCHEIARRTGCRVIKAFRVRSLATLRDLRRFRDVDLHLLDSYRADRPGGTGERFDWDLLRSYNREVPIILSGGLDADNVAAGIEQVHPYAVDVASGVEVKPGIKDHARLHAFFGAVAQADLVRAG